MSQTFDNKAMIPTKKMVGIVETVKQLRAMAKTAGLIGYSRMRKDQLVDLIESKTKRKFERKEKIPTVKEFRKMAKELGLVGISRLSKDKMMNRIEEKLERVRRDKENYFEVKCPKKALRGTMTTWNFNPLVQTDIQTFLKRTIPRRKDIFEEVRKKGIKVEVVLKILFVKMNPTDTREDDEKVGYFNSGYKVMNQGTDIVEELKAIDEKIGEKIAQETSEKSGWTLKRLICLYFNTDKYSPLKGSQYIALPKWIKDKKAVVNVGNNDAECFKWAVLSAEYYGEVDPKHVDRVKQYQRWGDELDFEGLEFPMEVDKIRKFERMNPQFAINVFAWEKEEIYNVRISEFAETQSRTTINLLLIEKEGRKHYAWIRNMSRLCLKQISDHNGEVKICCRCMQHFGDQEKLEDHLPQKQGSED